ncbi:MAG: chromosome segregation protein SMC [Myxococcota bacterium]|nr:chromosome segregation protein SMC [Myxococcota bacterium]MDP7075326.1 chromosome segregation protein SMC [Myxococcota bacterium]MDP7431899.1 chromosome segregation protein SMC [Myxococcota bacterium]MDP7570383.1 chromosome segregation protein SMC [Myxococcota bacterium]
MRIKSLELNGFKSFVDKTRIDFKPGITGVVGPNGCGKSNVVDAMRWVMGEQSPRRLRGKGMDDVIFAGSEGRAAVGMAEVVLTFDNTGGGAPPAFTAYAEIQVARRLYRTGESEYLLNGTSCRLRDVHDFFRDSGVGTKGYTIVEQGRIAEIVSAKPEDRRILIEEAAGIGKFKARRREAESKIKSTQQNLLRVTDVLAEIRRQINSIERQAKKAARYKRLRETARILELSLALDDRTALVEEIDNVGVRQRRLQDEITALETRLAERELAVEEKRIEFAECERVLSQGSETLVALRSEIKEAEGRIEYARRERETLAETAEVRRLELSQLREQRVGQEREVGETGDELRAIERGLASEREIVAKAEEAVRSAKADFDVLERERDAQNAQIVELLTSVARSEDRLAGVEDRTAELDAKLRSADEGLEVGQSEATRVDSEQRQLEDGLRNLLAERDRFMGLLRASLEAHEQAIGSEREAGDGLREAREKREMRRARLESLREFTSNHEDVGEAARRLLESDESTRHRFGLHGLLRDLFHVDADAETAVEAVLAERADALVVENAGGALEALQALRKDGAVRALFVTLPEAEPVTSGFVPMGEPLLDRVRPRQGYEELARRLLGGAYIVPDLREVVSVYGRGSAPATFVTPDGDVLTPEGLVRGGGDADSGFLERMREVRELEEEMQQLDARVASCQASVGESEAARMRAADELENLRNRHHTAALAVANHEKDLERTRERVKILGEAYEGRVEVRSEILAETDALAEEKERLGELLVCGREDRAEKQRALDALVLEIGSSGRELSRLETAATERRVEHAGRAEKGDRLRAIFERVSGAARETREWIARREQEISAAEARRQELAGTLESDRGHLEVKLGEEERARAGIESKRDAFERASAVVNSLDDAVREVRGEMAAKREAAGSAELAVRETELRLSHLDDSMREKWQLELATWSLPALESVTQAHGELEVSAQGTPGPGEPAAAGELAESEDEPAPDAAREARRNAELARLSREEREREFADARKKLQGLGDVNLGAIEEHEELAERFRFLSEQKSDLDATLASLRDAIARINRTSRRRFRETFEAVSKRFTENFPRLFQGGRASLSLTESEDVLEAGIDIMAMPPGKRLQNVNLLSGGEKTLTAIALLVAVFQVRPSPFFLLDEVDAALDDANVGRFNEIVQELATDSQFVLITHNKRTIEVSDLLYGVTMERKGVSKLVSVELH